MPLTNLINNDAVRMNSHSHLLTCVLYFTPQFNDSNYSEERMPSQRIISMGEWLQLCAMKCWQFCRGAFVSLCAERPITCISCPRNLMNKQFWLNYQQRVICADWRKQISWLAPRVIELTLFHSPLCHPIHTSLKYLLCLCVQITIFQLSSPTSDDS